MQIEIWGQAKAHQTECTVHRYNKDSSAHLAILIMIGESILEIQLTPFLSSPAKFVTAKFSVINDMIWYVLAEY